MIEKCTGESFDRVDVSTQKHLIDNENWWIQGRPSPNWGSDFFFLGCAL